MKLLSQVEVAEDQNTLVLLNCVNLILLCLIVNCGTRCTNAGHYCCYLLCVLWLSCDQDDTYTESYISTIGVDFVSNTVLHFIEIVIWIKS